MNRRSNHRSRAASALLLFCVLFPLCFACDVTPNADEGDSASKNPASKDTKKSAGETEFARAARGEGTTATVAGPAMDTAFVHRATGENSRGDYTYLSDPSIDGDPDAVVMVAPTMVGGSTGGATYDHNIGVWFEPEARKWAIFNQDRSAVPDGATFQVVVPGGPEKFVHRSGPGNISADATYLDDPLVNGEPEAVISVTQNWNPGGGAGTYNNHPVGVRYDAGRQRWAIHNEDGAAIPDGAAFNVAVSKAVQMTDGDAGDPGTEQDTNTGETTGQKPGPAEGTEQGELAGQAQPNGNSEGFPEYRNFYSEGDPKTPKVLTSGSSVGAIPAVQPFNFGRDPGGPEDKTLSITIPKIGVDGVPVFDTVSEEKLREGTVHIPATGYPWQKGANVFIAGHRLGYEGTPSYYVFFRLDELREGDEILLENSVGKQYLYRVTTRKVVGPDSVEVMNAVEGKSLVTLQTCTLPDYKNRLIVQGELVERGA